VAHTLLTVMNRKEVLSELAAIRCPTVVITGEDDTAQPAHNSEQIAAGIRGARLVRIPACGHSSSLEQPEAVITAMREVMNLPVQGRKTS
jgi:pimeloyl-ACP methyl ester carboxylesterase